MNPLIFIMMLFALLGLVDRQLHNRLGLGEEFDKGLAAMGPLALSMAGIYCFSVLLGEQLAAHPEWLAFLPFDPSVLAGCLLAPDLGLYSISANIAKNDAMGLLSGVILSSTIGTLISFSLPIALTSISDRSLPEFLHGMVFGIVTLPAAALIGGLMLGVGFSEMLMNLWPLLLLCVALALLLKKAVSLAIRIFLRFGRFIQLLTVFLFALFIIDAFWKSVLWIPDSLSAEILAIVFSITVTVCGAQVLSKVLLLLFSKKIFALSEKLGINEHAILGLMLSFVSGVPMFLLFDKMDRRGKLICASFLVSGAFIFGGQLAFISGVSEGSISAFLVSKMIAGLLAVLLAVFSAKAAPQKEKV